MDRVKIIHSRYSLFLLSVILFFLIDLILKIKIPVIKFFENKKFKLTNITDRIKLGFIKKIKRFTKLKSFSIVLLYFWACSSVD